MLCRYSIHAGEAESESEAEPEATESEAESEAEPVPSALSGADVSGIDMGGDPVTVIKFRRKLVTGDVFDHDITAANGNMNFVYAFGQMAPYNPLT
jgi:hypothetical protein